MITKKIKYEDYLGNEREDEFMFHLKKTELLDLNAEKEGGFINYIQSIIDSKDEGKLWIVFKEVVELSYGKRSADGLRFIKDPELTKEFEETEAFPVLITEFIEKPGAAEAFINGLMPADMKNQA
jgi:hypothetical protein